MLTTGCSHLPSSPTLRSSQLVEINTATNSDTALGRVGPNRTFGRRRRYSRQRRAIRFRLREQREDLSSGRQQASNLGMSTELNITHYE